MRNTRVERTRRNLDLRRPAHARRKPEPALRGAGPTLKLPNPLRRTETDKAIRILIADKPGGHGDDEKAGGNQLEHRGERGVGPEIDARIAALPGGVPGK